MKKILGIIVLGLLLSGNAYAALFYEGESILDIFNFDSQFWSDFGKEGVIRYYFLLFLLIVSFWFLDGVSFLEEFFFKKNRFKNLPFKKKKKKKSR
tara:strand:+ start:12 stop:299 length:288 start_codon:yes stop_codon:yes gene_type:complete